MLVLMSIKDSRNVQTRSPVAPNPFYDPKLQFSFYFALKHAEKEGLLNDIQEHFFFFVPSNLFLKGLFSAKCQNGP